MIVGRESEKRQLTRAYESKQSEFIAVYGRRRVGKTFLVRQVFDGTFAFSYSGMANVSTREQLQKFYLELKKHGLKENVYPKNWIEAFHLLELYLEALPKGYNAFATRGHEGELCHLEEELQIAREISGVKTPNMIVYGGGETCKSYCRQTGLIYIDPYQVDQRNSRREEASNG